MAEDKIEFSDLEISEIVSSIDNAPMDGYKSLAKNRAVYTTPFKKISQKIAEKVNNAIGERDKTLQVHTEELKKVGTLQEQMSTARGHILTLQKETDSKLGATLELTIDNKTFVLTASLIAQNGTPLSVNHIDLPIESMIVDMEYDKETKTLELRLQNGNLTTIPIGDVIEGLISASEKGRPNGVATLDESGKLPAEQLPDEYLPTTGGALSGPIEVSNGHETMTYDAKNLLLLDSDGIKKYEFPAKGGTLTVEETVSEKVNDMLEQAKAYTDKEIATFDFIKVVSALPEEGLPNKIYLVLKTEGLDNDFFEEYIWVNRGTEETPTYGWEFQGSKNAEIELEDYVKFTDYAGEGKYGVITGAKIYAFVISGMGVPQCDSFNLAEYKTKSTASFIGKGTLENVKGDIVKRAITENDITLTDEEKAAALAWIGAVPISSATSFQRVYGITAQGVQTMYIADATLNGAQPGRIPLRGTNGKIYVKTASIDENEVAVNKEYVDKVKGTKLYLHKFPFTYDAYNNEAPRYMSFISTSSEKAIVYYMDTVYTLDDTTIRWGFQLWSSDGNTLMDNLFTVEQSTYGDWDIYHSVRFHNVGVITFESLTDERYTVTEL